MKAGIYLGKEQIELRELPIPEVGDEDVLVENIYSSICGTDVSVYFHGPGTGHKVTVDMRRYHALLRLEKMLRTLR